MIDPPTSPPPSPSRHLPGSEDPHRRLYENVREAVSSVPIHFRTETHISGIMATDLHTLNTVLGATIEEQVVRTLNLTRSSWDPEDEYPLCSFVRQAQTFPDVLLRKSSTGEVLLGIELKGWYLLAKEAEPSLRFQVSPAACSDRDLIVVVPWVLSNVISGSPILFEPFVESARYAAEFRNHHWAHVRKSSLDASIAMPKSVEPYPSKSDAILDVPASDRGGNFGRLARTGLMDTYMSRLNHIQLCGIDTGYWRDFLKIFQDHTDDAAVRKALDRLRQKVLKDARLGLSGRGKSALAILEELERFLDGN